MRSAPAFDRTTTKREEPTRAPKSSASVHVASIASTTRTRSGKSRVRISTTNSRSALKDWWMRMFLSPTIFDHGISGCSGNILLPRSTRRRAGRRSSYSFEWHEIRLGGSCNPVPQNAARDYVDPDAEQLAQIFAQPGEIPQRFGTRIRQVDIKVYVAVVSRIAPGHGTKDSRVACAVSVEDLVDRRQVSPQQFPQFVRTGADGCSRRRICAAHEPIIIGAGPAIPRSQPPRTR